MRGLGERIHSVLGQEGSEMDAIVKCDRVVCVTSDVDAAYGCAMIVKDYWAVAVHEEFFVFCQERGRC